MTIVHPWILWWTLPLLVLAGACWLCGMLIEANTPEESSNHKLSLFDRWAIVLVVASLLPIAIYM